METMCKWLKKRKKKHKLEMHAKKEIGKGIQANDYNLKNVSQE